MRTGVRVVGVSRVESPPLMLPISSRIRWILSMPQLSLVARLQEGDLVILVHGAPQSGGVEAAPVSCPHMRFKVHQRAGVGAAVGSCLGQQVLRMDTRRDKPQGMPWVSC